MSARIPSKKLDNLYALFSANQLEALERAARDCTRRHPAAAAGWQMLGVLMPEASGAESLHASVDAMIAELRRAG